MGKKLRNYLKNVKALLQIKINCIKVVLKSHIYIIYNCSKRIKTVINLNRGFLRGSKRIKKGKISMKSKEINERRTYLKKMAKAPL